MLDGLCRAPCETSNRTLLGARSIVEPPIGCHSIHKSKLKAATPPHKIWLQKMGQARGGSTAGMRSIAVTVVSGF